MASKANSIDEGYFSGEDFETHHNELLSSLIENFRLLSLGSNQPQFVSFEPKYAFLSNLQSSHAISTWKESTSTALAESRDPQIIPNVLLVDKKTDDLGIILNMDIRSCNSSYSTATGISSAKTQVSRPSDISLWYKNFFKSRQQKLPNRSLLLPRSFFKIGSCSEFAYRYHGPCETFEEFAYNLNGNFDYFKLGNFTANVTTGSSTVEAKIRRYPSFYGQNSVCQVRCRAIKRSCGNIQAASPKRSRYSFQKLVHFKICQRNKMKHKEVHMQYRFLRNQQYWALINISSILPAEAMEIEISDANARTVEKKNYDIQYASDTEVTDCTSTAESSEFGCWCGAENLESCVCADVADAFLSAQEML